MFGILCFVHRLLLLLSAERGNQIYAEVTFGDGAVIFHAKDDVCLICTLVLYGGRQLGNIVNTDRLRPHDIDQYGYRL